MKPVRKQTGSDARTGSVVVTTFGVAKECAPPPLSLHHKTLKSSGGVYETRLDMISTKTGGGVMTGRGCNDSISAFQAKLFGLSTQFEAFGCKNQQTTSRVPETSAEVSQFLKKEHIKIPTATRKKNRKQLEKSP